MTSDAQISQEMTTPLLTAGLDGAITCAVRRLEALRAGSELPPFEVPEQSALAAAATVFSLGVVEQEILCISAGAEFDASVGAAITSYTESGICDVALFEWLLGAVAWDALCPEAPLRHWRLVELVGSEPLRNQHVRIDERVLQYLRGISYVDTRLAGILRPLFAEAELGGARHKTYSGHIVRAWSTGGPLPVILFGGRDATAKRDIFASACAELGLQAFRLDARDIPTDWSQRSALAIFLDRELAMSIGAVLIEHNDTETGLASTRLADAVSGPTILAAQDPQVGERTPFLRIELENADRDERRTLWHAALGPKAKAFGPIIERMTEQFSLDTSAVHIASGLALSDPLATPEDAGDILWQAAREQGRRRFDGLAERIESRVDWSDLVLPQESMSVLRDLAGHLKKAWVVNQTWGWAEKGERGLGASALFAGPSGTGKTLAAEMLANELRLDLYRIDLSQVVSKYIGETEKNLSRIFAAAEGGGAILLFDEADALFGKRSEVKDSHDRYANVEVSYLLQRMEAYRGLAVLTTNQKSAVDQAFLRRLRYVVSFPFPNADARAAIWAQIFPQATPVEGLDPTLLARLNIAGGSIRSIALNAAFLAANSGERVSMAHLQRSALREYAKLEKPFTNAEAEAFG